MNRVAAVLVAALTLIACSGRTDGDDATSDQDIHSVATSFYLNQPFAGARMNTLSHALAGIDDKGTFVRNYELAAGVHWAAGSGSALTEDQRTALVQAGYTFWMRQNDPTAPNKSYARNLKRARTNAELDAAIDAIGLTLDVPSDAAGASARKALLATLESVAALDGVSVYSADLPKEDMSWYGLLVVVDETNDEILFETGGYGN